MTAKVRCAVYTRKSTEEGLDQHFNSLDAQREACEAYIQSQAGERWCGLPERYDDGGYSGGNLDRPAMQALLRAIDAGKVDVIVVYKVDRLTRSLMDFAKIVERLDARGVSFVSVTQAFNTTTSMGRLTLNVLLSFAQFEREVTGERIRDKIAASKARGMWMGGNVPLGYDLGDRRLVLNRAEAEQVRHIFARYVELRSGVKLVRELREAGMFSKRWISKTGRERGGKPLSCGALYYLLQNRIYVGEICHRGRSHRGEHEAIICSERFDAVQAAITANRRGKKERSTRSTECPLVGIVHDSDGRPMTTSFSYGRGGKLYRYYVTGTLDPSRSRDAPRPVRVPAAPLERLVVRSLCSLLERQVIWEEVRSILLRVDLRERSIQLILKSERFLEPHETVDAVVELLRSRLQPHRLVADGKNLTVIADRKPIFHGGATGKITEVARNELEERDGRAMLRSAHDLLEKHSMSPLNHRTHAQASAPSYQRQRRLMALGLIAPTLQKVILQNQNGISEQMFEAAPLAWIDQLRCGVGGP